MEMEDAIHRVVLSGKTTVVPARPTGPQVTHVLNSRDLCMKPHYIRAVYYFRKNGVQNCSNKKLKEAFFRTLMEYTPVAGRLDSAWNGKPSCIRCNDAGVRIIEAFSDAELGNWADLKDCYLELDLSSDQRLGAELTISPLVIIQFTSFKCGGIGIGLNWSHILGDAFSASHFVKAWGETYRGMQISCPPSFADLPKPSSSPSNHPEPSSRHHVTNPSDGFQENTMEMASFHFSNTVVEQLLSEIQPEGKQSKSKPMTPFVAVSAFLWKAIMKTRHGAGSDRPRAIFCVDYRKLEDNPNVPSFHFGNDQIFTQVQCEDHDRIDLCSIAHLIQNIATSFSVGKPISMADCVNGEAMLVYGSVLTFVNWEHLPYYDLMFEEEGPLYVSCMVVPVGNNGMVIVMPSYERGNGRLVKVSLCRDEMMRLKEELLLYSIV